MRLSILIPTFNYTVLPLVRTLSEQGELSDISYEIIVADDASTDDSPMTNQDINRLPHCRFIIQEQNMGRARIRNWLAEQASGDLLLFMDCDALVTSPDFISRYVRMASEAPVLCGGLRHPEALPHPDVTLRYYYEKEADRHRTADCRKQTPYERFATFCFAVRRDTFLSIKFDENCQEYGYEDTLFGEELKRRNIPICHFENPLIHMGLEPNHIFLKKTEVALRSLYLHADKLGTSVRIHRTFLQLQRFGLVWLVRAQHRLFAPLWRRNLLGKHPNLSLFALYKLGYYATLHLDK